MHECSGMGQLEIFGEFKLRLNYVANVRGC